MAGFTKEAGYSHEEDIKNEIIQKYKATEYNNPDFKAAETSPKRQKEYESLMKL